MSAKLGRNDPCPCGSGKKYKQCCLALDQEAERRGRLESAAIETTLVFLHERHEEALNVALSEGFFGLYDPEIEAEVDELPEEYQDIVWSNAYEWLLAEGTLELEGGIRRAAELLDDPDLPLEPEQRQWLLSLSRHPLGLYRVERHESTSGVWLRDLLEPEKDLLFLAERYAAEMYLLEEVVALRLLPEGEHWRSSFAVYPFEEEDLEMLVAAIRAAEAWAEGGEPPSRSEIVIENWFNTLFEFVEEEEGDGLAEDEWDGVDEADNDDEPAESGPRAV